MQSVGLTIKLTTRLISPTVRLTTGFASPTVGLTPRFISQTVVLTAWLMSETVRLTAWLVSQTVGLTLQFAGPFALQSADPTRNGQSKIVRKDQNIQFQSPDQKKDKS